MAFGFVDFAAVALAVLGLGAVIWEIAVKNPRSLVEMATDSRRFAEQPVAGASLRIVPPVAVPAAAAADDGAWRESRPRAA